METHSKQYRPPRQVVVKIGSSVCAGPNGLKPSFFRRFASDLAHARETYGCHFVVVSSGAIAAGFRALNLKTRPTDLALKTASAAVGQVKLVNAYEAAFKPYRFHAGQVLITASDLERRSAFLNAKRTLQSLLRKNVVPIVNENDTVSVEEILYGDNDLLSASVAHLVEAELLIILSHLSGIKGEKRIFRNVKDLERIKPYLSHSMSRLGSGGVASKIEAVRRCAAFGIPTIVAAGQRTGVVSDILGGRRLGTAFGLMPGKTIRGKKFWLAFGARTAGKVWVDAGAARALREGGASLLPMGVTKVRGIFKPGEVVELLDPKDLVIGRGIVAYGSGAIQRLRGRSVSEMSQILGFVGKKTIIHRDEMVIL